MPPIGNATDPCRSAVLDGGQRTATDRARRLLGESLQPSLSCFDLITFLSETLQGPTGCTLEGGACQAQGSSSRDPILAMIPFLTAA